MIICEFSPLLQAAPEVVDKDDKNERNERHISFNILKAPAVR